MFGCVLVCMCFLLSKMRFKVGKGGFNGFLSGGGRARRWPW
jgi:hypothetical protein